MQLDELIGYSREDVARFQVLAKSFSLDEACEVALNQRMDWLMSDPERMKFLARRVGLEWLAYVLASYQGASGRKFHRLPRAFEHPSFDSFREPIKRGLLDTPEEEG